MASLVPTMSRPTSALKLATSVSNRINSLSSATQRPPYRLYQVDKVAGERPKDSQISSAGIPASSCRKAAVICAWLNSGARIGATPHYRFRFRRRTVRNALTQILVVSLRTSNLRTRASARRISWNGSKIPDEDQLLAKGFRAAWSLLS